MTRYIVNLKDEATRIGSGWRVVTVEVGRKWVKLKGANGSGRLTLDRWQEIARTAQLMPDKKKRRHARKGEPKL